MLYRDRRRSAAGHWAISVPPHKGMHLLPPSYMTKCPPYLQVAPLCFMLAGLLRCGGADTAAAQPSAPWGDDVTVIGPDGAETDYSVPQGSTCISTEGGGCITTQERCGQGVPADVVVDAQGNVVDVVCYPTSGTLTPEQLESLQGNLAQNQNGSVVVLDAVSDGVDLNGNLAIDANKVVIYGYGPDVSVTSGDLTVDGNNTIVRGIRVLGNVDVLKNDSVLVYCVIEGDVRIVGNNTHLSGCDIFGSVRIEGNNSVLNGNRIQGTVENVGTNSSCTNNLTFGDLNADHMVQPGELGTPISCE